LAYNSPLRGIPQLTERDRYVLSWIGDQYGVRLDTLQKLLGRAPGRAQIAPKIEGLIATSNVYRIIRRWETLGLVEYQKFWDDSPGWVWLTPTGLRARGMNFAPWTPRQGTEFEHLHTINELRFWLEGRYSILLPWQSDRALKREAGELTEREQAKKQIPDALTMIDGTQIAIQVELTSKSHFRTERVIRSLLDQYAGVWYFVSDSTEALIRKHSRSSPKVKVYKLSEVLPVL
jgi:hypothetical protein